MPDQPQQTSSSLLTIAQNIVKAINGLSNVWGTGVNSGNITISNAVGTSFAQVIGANSKRRKITFHNPGTVNLYIGPIVLGSGASNAPTLSALAGAFVVFPGADRVVDGSCQMAWAAMASGGTTNPITISEY